MKIRKKIFQSDLEQIEEIVESTGFFHSYEVKIASEVAEEAIQKGEEESGYHFIFIEENGKTIAFASYGEIPCTKNRYDLYWIVVHNNYRNKGLGSILLAEVEKEINESGGKSIYVETSSKEKYIPTRAFYTKNNYTVEAEMKDFYEDGDNKVVFIKKF